MVDAAEAIPAEQMKPIQHLYEMGPLLYGCFTRTVGAMKTKVWGMWACIEGHGHAAMVFGGAAAKVHKTFVKSPKDPTGARLGNGFTLGMGSSGVFVQEATSIKELVQAMHVTCKTKGDANVVEMKKKTPKNPDGSEMKMAIISSEVFESGTTWRLEVGRLFLSNGRRHMDVFTIPKTSQSVNPAMLYSAQEEARKYVPEKILKQKHSLQKGFLFKHGEAKAKFFLHNNHIERQQGLFV